MGGLLLKKGKPPAPKPDESLKPLIEHEEVPIPVYNFSIEIGTDTVALFQKCSGLEVKRDTEKITQGGLNGYVIELPGQISFGHVTFETGMTSSGFFWGWMIDGQLDGWIQKKSFTLIQRRPDTTANSYAIVRKWNFIDAFPVKWSITDLDLSNADKIAIETLELSFKYFEAVKV